MNRKKINCIILAMGTMLTLSFGSNINVKAEEVYTKTLAVQNKVEVSSEESAAIDKINNGQAELRDYRGTLKLRTVDSHNIDTVKAAIKKAIEDKGSILTKEEIINVCEDAYNVYYFYEKLNNTDDLPVFEYSNRGLQGVNEDNVQFFNNAFKIQKYLSRKDMQSYIDKIINSINAICDGVGGFEDYRNIGADGSITKENIVQVNKAEAKAFQVKGSTLNIDEIKSTAQTASASVIANINKINDGCASLNDYIDLNIKNVDSNNMKYVNVDLKGRNLTKVEDIQNVIDNHKEVYSSLDKINLGSAVIEDYKNIGLKDAEESNLDFLNNKMKSKNFLSSEEAKNAGEKILKVEVLVNKINKGDGAVEDYEAVGAVGVTSANVEYVNKEIVGSLDAYGTNIQSQVTMILTSYKKVNAVNNGLVQKSDKGFVLEYFDITGVEVEFDTKADSEFSIIRDCIKIDRKILNNKALSKDEITAIIKRVHSNLEDAKIVIAEINKSISETEAVLERALTAKEEENLVDKVISSRKYAVTRLYLGNATVEDFTLFGERRVSESNLKIINDDIKQYKGIKKLSAYRLEGVSREVTAALAIFSINEDNLTKDSDNNVKEFAALGKAIAFDYDRTSTLRVMEDYIQITRRQNGNRQLDRSEILNIIEDVQNNIEQYRILIPAISDEIFAAENKNGEKLSKEETNEIVTNVQNKLKDAVSRLVLGLGTVDDFKLYGETRVDEAKLEIVNKDIKDCLELTKTSSYSIKGLKEAVDKGIAVYNLNNGIETAGMDGNVSELEAIGVIVQNSNDANSLDKKIMDRIKTERSAHDNKVLSRNDIKSIADIVRNDESKKKDDGTIKPTPDPTPTPAPSKNFFDKIKDWFKNIFKKFKK